MTLRRDGSRTCSCRTISPWMMEASMPEYGRSKEALARLSPEQFRITQHGGTEPPGTGELLDNYESGIYVAIVRGAPRGAPREQSRIPQAGGADPPGTGELLDNYESGIYVDIVSGEPLFASS